MKLKFLTLLVLAIASATACQNAATRAEDNAKQTDSRNISVASAPESSNALNSPDSNAVNSTNANKTAANSKTNANQPKTVREFFALLPQKYFPLEGCSDNPTAKNCDRARAEYLKNNLEVEDAANGYMKGGCDGAQSCFQMALFKRPNDAYIVGLTTAHELDEQSYFLEYAGGAWKDIGAQTVPEYGKDKIYEMPRIGTIVAVYEYKRIAGEDFSERGRKLYDLIWKDGKFAIKK